MRDEKECSTCSNKRACSAKRLTAAVLETLEQRQLLSTNPIVTENQLPGTPESTWWVDGDGDGSIQGFSTDISVNHGQMVSFKIDDKTKAAYHLDIYRMGYYQGDGARLVTTIPSSQTLKTAQVAPLTNATTGLVDCGNWTVSATWTVPSNAVSGIYFANIVREDTGGKSQIFFIVRDDASHSQILYQTSDTTWEAYNAYSYTTGQDNASGNSLYTGTSLATVGQAITRAVAVSYNRPLVVGGIQGGLGDYNHPLFAEYPMVRWMEENGYDVTYFTGLDADRNGSEILQHQIYMDAGHDEYWSGGQRTNVEAARDAGVNLAFFSGNESYWKVRWTSSSDPSATPYRTMVCYKDTHAQGFVDPSGIWTGQWRDSRFGPHDGGIPENEMTGQIFSVNRDIQDIGTNIMVPAAYSSLRLWRNTSIASLAPGQVATLSNGTLGYEWDEDIDNGFRPAGLVDFSSTTHVVSQKLLDRYSGYGAPCPNCPAYATAGCGCVVASDTATHSLTEYRAASGALVFGAGTVQWSWGLDDHHMEDAPGGAAIDPRMQQATVNLLADMGVQPGTLEAGLVAATKSTDVTPPTAVITVPTNGGVINMGTTLTITGTATDAGGGVVGGVEVSTDGGKTWNKATGTNNWTFAWSPPAGGTYTLMARAVDDSLNLQTVTPGVSVNVVGPAGQTVFGTMTPTDIADDDTVPIEVGMKFQTDIGGNITGMRFYKFATNTGTHIGNLWTATGTKLATVTFTNETASGWQYAAFSTPIAIQANTTYVVSYFMTKGQYASDENYFNSARSLGTGDVRALADSAGGNGLYTYSSSSTFPTSTYQASNFYVDVIFQVGVDNTPPTVTTTSPAAGATNVGTTLPITATFSEQIKPASLSFVVKDASNQPVAGTVTYNNSAQTATFTPTLALAATSVYTATVTATDLANNAMTTPKVWSFTTSTPDITPPTIVTRSPAAGATGVAPLSVVTVTFSEAVKNDASLSMVLKDASNNVVPATVSYNSATFTATLTPTSAMALLTTYTVVVGATDLSGNAMSPASWSFTTSANVTGSIWAGTVVPVTPADDDGSASEVGTKFRSSMAGYITAIRYYKSSTNTGTHVGHLWTSTGTLLATVTFTGETTTGWQQATLSTPVAIAANTTYVVSYYAPKGHYAEDDRYFATSVTNGPLTALADGTDGPNGVYAYSTGSTFPTQTWLSANYYVDVVFSATVADITPPTIASRTPAVNATNVSTGTTVTVTFNEPVKNDASLSVVLKNSANQVVPATVSYNAATLTATLTPTAALAGGTVYTATVGATDIAGNVMTPASWSFTTTVPDTTPPSVTARTPAAGATNVALNSTATATFSEAVQSGSILFTLTNTATNTPVAGTVSYASGTNVATFTPTAALAAGVTYSASVSATDIAGNAMAAPSTWTFTTTPPDLTPPIVTGETPLAGATNVALNSTATATFSEAVQSGSILFTLTNTSTSALVSGTVSYNANTSTATFTPTTALAAGVTYSASASATDIAGNAMAAPTTWTFTTTPPDLTPPSVTARTPASGATGVAITTTATATFSEAVQSGSVVFTLTNTLTSTAVPGTTTYNANTSTATFTPTSTLAYSATYSASVKATDIAGNAMATPVTWTFTTVAQPVGPLSLWTTSTVPTVKADPDSAAVELGVKFQSDVAGTITGLRFYKGTGNTGTHTGHLWSSTGTLLASATFTGETATGWQTVTFATPVTIAPNTVYVASYLAPKGHYAADSGYFTSTGVNSGPLHALQDGVSGGDGVYHYGATSAFPSSTYQGTNYWVDVLFTPTTLAVSAKTPAAGAVSVPVTTTVTVTFNVAINSTSLSLVLRDASNQVVPATVTYNATTRVATLTPTSLLLAGTTYTATVSAIDPLGNIMNPLVWTFAT